MDQNEQQNQVESLNQIDQLDQNQQSNQVESIQDQNLHPNHYVDQLATESGFDTSSYDNSKDLKKPGNPWKIVGIVTSALSILFLLVASFLYFYSNQKIDEGTKLVKQ